MNQQSLISGLYYKPMTIVNDDSRVINKLEASITDDNRVVFYDHHMFIVQATGNFKSMNVAAKKRVGFIPCSNNLLKFFQSGANVIKLFTDVSYEFL